ncbi:hypothetical protein GQR58_027344 [Nymphon striatum]|nr:hypothetical protein GQR58_027344 [Nymphon striatum]
MSKRHIVFVPGKNPKPPADLHQNLLWQTLVEGVRRVEPDVAENLASHDEYFRFINWNYSYYQSRENIEAHRPWVDKMLAKGGPSDEDIELATAWRHRLDMFMYNTVDNSPVLMRLLRGKLKEAADDTHRYFENENKIASHIREQLKEELRPLLQDGHKVLLIGHSMGTIISYDTLWALSNLEAFTRIYLNIATGYYFYPYKNRWRKVRSLPRSYHLNHHDRVTIRIKSKDRPYVRHHVHRTKYAPRRYYRDRNRDKHRTKVRVKRSYDYYYYPNSRVYYNAKTGYYYYPSRKSWKRSKRIPSKYRLKHRDRVKVKVASKYKPYKNHKAHRARYAPRYNYHKNRVKKQINRYERTKVKDYEKGGINYHEQIQQLIKENDFNIDALQMHFGRTRDDLIQQNETEWLAKNPLFEGVSEKLKSLKAEDWLVITTKQERFCEKDA